jgi:hypothetical protein
MTHHSKKYIKIYIALAIILAAGVFLYHFPPDRIVEYVGIENSYLATFLIAAVGGLNALTSSVFYAAVATFSSGGANPWLLGVAGGIGIALGDSIIYGLLAYGIADVDKKWKNKIIGWKDKVDTYPTWVFYVGLFLLLGVTPMPNDIVMLALVLLGVKYLTVAPIIFLAGISITTITALLGESLSSYFFG